MCKEIPHPPRISGGTLFDSTDNRVICSGLVVVVCFDFDLQAPVGVYDSIKQAYEA